jgi:hypothetical protein
MNQDTPNVPCPPREDEDQLPPGYMYGSWSDFDPDDLDPEKIFNLLLSDFPENILHDFREEMRIVYDSEGQEVTEPVVAMAAALIFQAPSLLVNYPVPELFTRVNHILDRSWKESVRTESAPTPTFADIRRQIRHKLTAALGSEASEQVLNRCCGVLATLVLNSSRARTRLRCPDVPEGDDLIGYTVNHLAGEFVLLAGAYWRLDEEAVARGLRGMARDSWCVARVNTEFMGRPPGRRARQAKRHH